jgi:hypothetical protein
MRRVFRFRQPQLDQPADSIIPASKPICELPIIDGLHLLWGEKQRHTDCSPCVFGRFVGHSLNVPHAFDALQAH